MERMTYLAHIFFITISSTIALFGAVITFWVLDPKIGIDDANITQAYARHIADGLGYVYNQNGDWVEGSTSIAWTLINALVFWLFDKPEAILTAICFVMTIGIIWCTMMTATELVEHGRVFAPIIAAMTFCAFPGLFAWMVWALMDVTLWVLLVAVLILALLRAEKRLSWRTMLALALVACLLPLTRPEGLILVLAVAGFYVARRMIFGNGNAKVGALLGGIGLISFFAVTLWRLFAFGTMFPNTFYAKSSSDILGQVERGVRYVLFYFDQPQNVLFVVFFCVGGALIVIRNESIAQRSFLALALYLIIGGAALYVVLGGDHFGSHRFFLYFLPVGVPLIAAAFADAIVGASAARSYSTALLLVAFGLVGSAGLVRFVQSQGDLRIEFAIAEEGRELGEWLNSLPGNPIVGVVAAGGVRMTFKGEILDLMGLNWIQMAQAPDDAITADIPGHTSFKPDVFWMYPPDVIPVFPSSGKCPFGWSPLEGFLDTVTDHITGTERFRDYYALYCHEGETFYVGRRFAEREWDFAWEIPYQKLSEDF